MSSRFGFYRLPTIVAAMAVVLSVAACAIELRRGEDHASVAPSSSQKFDPLKKKLEQCRTVTSDQATALDECRRLWSENRSRFLGRRNSDATQSYPCAEGGQSPISPSIKDQSHLPKGYPPVAPLESE